jgi:hypothetical protein
MAFIRVGVGTLVGERTTTNATAQTFLDLYFQARAPTVTEGGTVITYTNQQKMDWIALDLAKHIEYIAKSYRREQKQITGQSEIDQEFSGIQM